MRETRGAAADEVRSGRRLRHSVIEATELALRHHLFSVTDDAILTVVQEAVRPFDITETNDKLIKSMTSDDCTLAPPPTT